MASKPAYKKPGPSRLLGVYYIAIRQSRRLSWISTFLSRKVDVDLRVGTG